MLESISELRKIAQEYKSDNDGLYRKYILRPVSIFITRAFIQFGIKADFITLLSLLCGAVSFAFLITGKAFGFICGVIFIQLWYLFDTCDGEVARYHYYKQGVKETEEHLSGRYFDYINHHFVHLILPFGLAMGLFKVWGDISILLAGFLLSVSTLFTRLLEDCKYSVFLTKIIKAGKVSILQTNSDYTPNMTNIFRKIFSALFSFLVYPKLMVFMSLAIMIDILFFPFTMRVSHILIKILGYAGLFIIASKAAYTVSRRQLESDYKSRITELK